MDIPPLPLHKHLDWFLDAFEENHPDGVTTGIMAMPREQCQQLISFLNWLYPLAMDAYIEGSRRTMRLKGEKE